MEREKDNQKIQLTLNPLNYADSVLITYFTAFSTRGERIRELKRILIEYITKFHAKETEDDVREKEKEDKCKSYLLPQDNKQDDNEDDNAEEEKEKLNNKNSSTGKSMLVPVVSFTLTANFFKKLN